MKQQSLSASQIEFVCDMVSEYMRICQSNSKPLAPDSVEHSSLLRRLLSGQKALAEPPPMRFGLPSYELVEAEEVEIERLESSGDEVSVDEHPGYRWRSQELGILEYPRLGLVFQYTERDVVPDSDCIQEGCDPSKYRYTGKFLRRSQ